MVILYEINKKFTNKTKYKKFFSNRVITKWNGLPAGIITSDSINNFKNRLDKYHKDIMYKVDINYFD